MADSESILQLGIEAARAGDKAEARELFRLVTREDPENAQGWLWLAGVAEDRDEKRAALERVVELDPDNDLARKGLSALSGGRSGDTAASQAPSTPDDTGTAVAASAAAGAGGARTYDTPDGPAGDDARVEDADTWTAPTFDADEYDLDDYQQTPRAGDDDGHTRVVVEDEEPQRRRGLGWLIPLIAIPLILIAGFFLWRTLNRDAGVAGRPGTAATGGGLGGGDATATATGGDLGASGGATDTTASPVTGTGALNETATATGGDPGVTGTDVAAGGEVTGTVPAEGQPAGGDAGAPADQTAASGAGETAAPPAAGETTIVIVPPDATVVPPAVTEAPPAAAPETPPPPPAAGDVAAANPAIVPTGEVVQSGPWAFTFGGLQNIATGSYGGSPPTRGQYKIILLAVGNTGGQPATIPDGYFVLKDAQGRVYDFNRAASVEYLNRFGGPGVAADVGADATFPNNGQLTSVPLLFDVPTDATNLVLFSRDNVNQGFLIP